MLIELKRRLTKRSNNGGSNKVAKAKAGVKGVLMTNKALQK